MFKKLKELFFGKAAEKLTETMVPAPYKIETPGAFWPFPRASETTPENHVRVESVEPVADPVPVKKTPAKKTPAKKTPAKKTPAKKTPAAKKATTLDLEFWRAEHAKEYGPYNADNLTPLDSELESYAHQRIAGGYVRP